MIRNRRIWRLLGIVVATICASALAAEKPLLTAEWVYGEGSHVADIPEFRWLNDGTALLYDTRVPAAQRTIERLDPATGQRHAAVDMKEAVASLTSLVKDSSVKDVLPWPDAIDGAGKQAAYVIQGDVFLLDMASSRFTRLTETVAAEKDPEFSPDGRFVSFVRDNDLYVYDVAGKKETRLTSDGSQTTLNGTLSWVYWEEVFGRRDTAYWWSPDSLSIAYLQSDEAGVPVSTFVDFAPVDPRIIHQVYPKAGEKNPRVRVGVVKVGEASTRWIDIKGKPYEWILRVKWLPDSARLSVQTLNRTQTEMALYFADTSTGVSRLILTESDPFWVNTSDDLFFLKDGAHFLWASERDGYMHLYRYKLDGNVTNQVTKGEWALASAGGVAAWLRRAVVGIDAEQDWIYFTALKESSIERHLYRIKSDGSGLTKLTTEAGTHRITMSPDARHYFDVYSNIRELPALRLCGADGKTRATLAPPRPELLPADMQYPELMTIPTPDGFRLPAQILRPKNFDPAHKYPVILFVYGMPSIPTIHNAWQPALLNNQLLLEDGYVVVGMDGRASTGISKKLENLYGTNHDTTTDDLVAGVRWLKSQPWVDGSRFGVWGWSGGGTTTLTLMTHSKEFKAGIAGAPVTDWRYYDSKTSEMVLGLPEEKAEGYDGTSLVKRAGNLSGHVMLIFGSYDDNVHPQNEYAFMNELIKNDKLFEMMVYPMRKHGFTDTAARVHLSKTMREFWKKNL